LRKNKSAIKKAIQAEGRRVRNAHVKSTMKTKVKKVLAAVEGNSAELGELFTNAVASINKAKSKKVIHKNSAARKVSRLSKKVHKVLATKS
jgi:small subunit ribosomal protein S20